MGWWRMGGGAGNSCRIRLRAGRPPRRKSRFSSGWSSRASGRRRSTITGSCRISGTRSIFAPRRSDPFDPEPPLEKPVLNLPLALKLGHLHELTNQVSRRELLHLVVLHPIAIRPHDLARLRIEEGTIVWVRFTRATPDDPRRVIRMPEEQPIGVALQFQRLHADYGWRPPTTACSWRSASPSWDSASP